MSENHSAPSGPVRIVVGRNQLSVEARNSLFSSPAARSLLNVTPSGVSTWRWIRLCTGSLTNQLLANAGPNSWSR